LGILNADRNEMLEMIIAQVLTELDEVKKQP
jgi:hypothetical protein